MPAPYATTGQVEKISRQIVKEEVNKKEIEEIVRETVKNKISSYPDCADVLEFDGNSHPLTDEIYAFIVKCFEAEKIKNVSYHLNLNFTDIDSATGKISALCFGCEVVNSESDHNSNGAHLEIEIDWDSDTPTYVAIFAEL